MRIVFDISLCPTSMEIDGDILDEMSTLQRIRDVAEENRDEDDVVEFRCLQIGHRQGDEWAHCWVNGKPQHELANELIEEIDWSDEELYEDDENAV